MQSGMNYVRRFHWKPELIQVGFTLTCRYVRGGEGANICTIVIILSYSFICKRRKYYNQRISYSLFRVRKALCESATSIHGGWDVKCGDYLWFLDAIPNPRVAVLMGVSAQGKGGAHPMTHTSSHQSSSKSPWAPTGYSHGHPAGLQVAGW